MTTNPTVVYRSKNTVQAREALQESQRRLAAYNKHLAELGEELGEVVHYNAHPLYAYALGYEAKGPEEEPREGFRYDKNKKAMVPALRTKEGRAWRDRIDQVTYNQQRPEGLSEMVFGVGRMQPWIIEELAGDVYATLTIPVDESRISREVSSLLWERVPLSEYHKLLESQDAQEG